MFKKALLLLLICFSATLWAQNNEPNAQQTRDIEGLIAAYGQALDIPVSVARWLIVLAPWRSQKQMRSRRSVFEHHKGFLW